MDKKREFRRESIDCVFYLILSDEKNLSGSEISNAFGNYVEDYILYAKKMAVPQNRAKDPVLNLLQEKLMVLSEAVFSNFFKNKKRVTFSRKGLSFRDNNVLDPDRLVYMLLVFPNQLMPYFFSGFILRTDPIKESQEYKYVINFDKFYQSTEDMFSIYNI